VVEVCEQTFIIHTSISVSISISVLVLPLSILIQPQSLTSFFSITIYAKGNGYTIAVYPINYYQFEMDTEKERQCRCDDMRLTESGNARSEQLLVVRTESLTIIILCITNSKILYKVFLSPRLSQNPPILQSAGLLH